MITMKNLLIKLFALVLLVAPMMTSCIEDDDNPQPDQDVKDKLAQGIMMGTLQSDYTLSSSMSYQLDGAFIVAEGATLTIEAGTNILAKAGGTDVYIAVLMGGKIRVDGTSTLPVVMASKDANPGDWGGLTICGRAVTSAGANATAEVGGFTYGGSDPADNSGNIDYLVIKGTGAQINDESQYNGVSFYAVGYGTRVNNLAVINGADDGVEFFGGSVKVTNLFLQNTEDDAIDWTEEWDGEVTNAYIEHSIEGFSTAFEGDKDNANPKFTNITCVSTTGGTALQFKKTSGGTITGLYLNGYDVDLDMKDGGNLSNVTINGAAADGTLISGESSKYTLNSGKDAEPLDVSGWTWVDADVVKVWPGTTLGGEVTGVWTLSADVAYTLDEALIIKDGASLAIPAGTKITAVAGGTDIYVAVLMGGQIFINGTADHPVVMSSANGNPRDWGGLTICGKGVTSAGANATAEVGGFVYGGDDNEDDSGNVTYLVIKGTGAQINNESQYNGVSLYAVGSKTVLENIAVINGADDGIEFFGGAAEVTNLYIENCEDDAVDWTEEWSGGVENTYILHEIDGFSTAFEADKDNANPTFKNVTAISTTGGIALQFKKESGATITGLYLSGYEVDVDMKDNGSTTSVIIDGAVADLTNQGVADKYYYTLNSGKDSTPVDISGWTWISASL